LRCPSIHQGSWPMCTSYNRQQKHECEERCEATETTVRQRDCNAWNKKRTRREKKARLTKLMTATHTCLWGPWTYGRGKSNKDRSDRIRRERWAIYVSLQLERQCSTIKQMIQDVKRRS
jgi:hypothetical protein